ncbi:carbonic anhydrase [Stenotrophomonas sp. WHRI 8082]|uniref:carbonic anhydrase n=1 Tax=Stenotrophomonas sp. WHRI 8082 TaxID=3162571 RepID=UPI0032EC03DC
MPFLAHTSLFRTGLLAAAVCATAALASASGDPPHWGYDTLASPAQWAGIAPACAGPQQSPIDLWSSDIKHGARSALESDYQDTRFEVINNGHTLQATPQPGGAKTITLDGETFTLAQFHVHTPSEHHVDGKAHDMELHLVHTSASGKVAVVAVFFDVGKPNNALGELFDRTTAELSQPGERIRLYAPINPARLLPDHSRVVHYTGSLTTPPCTEGVLWNIEMEPQTLSRQQLDALRSVFPHNARPIQSFNKRTLIDEPAAP